MTQAPTTLEEIKDYIFEQLPRVLEQDPRFVTFIEGIVAEKFPRRDEFARLLDEVQQHRQETRQQFERIDQRLADIDNFRQETRQQFEQVDQRFEQVDQRFEQVDQRFEQVDQRFDRLEQQLDDRFYQLQQAIDRLGQRWGIHNEKLFRQTMREILEKNFGVQVRELHLRGEQFDCLILGDQHILVEIAASVGQDIQKRLERKRQIYMDETGVTPARFILAVGSMP
jgi:hypothetical protein